MRFITGLKSVGAFPAAENKRILKEMESELARVKYELNSILISESLNFLFFLYLRSNSSFSALLSSVG